MAFPQLATNMDRWWPIVPPPFPIPPALSVPANADHRRGAAGGQLRLLLHLAEHPRVPLRGGEALAEAFELSKNTYWMHKFKVFWLDPISHCDPEVHRFLF